MAHAPRAARAVEVAPGPVQRTLGELTDDELRRYRFQIDSPESFPNFTRSKPAQGERFTRLVHNYDIPHRKNSRERMIWCAYCQKRNHFCGALAEYDSGKCRSIGWKCCKDHFDEDVRKKILQFVDRRTRARRLHQTDQIGIVLPDFTAELNARSVRETAQAFDAIRFRFENEMPGLWQWLSTVAYHERGSVKIEEEYEDYSSTALTKEDGEKSSESRLKGQRTRYRVRTFSVSGWQLFHPNRSLIDVYRKVLEKAEDCHKLYSTIDTEDFDTKSLGNNTRRVEELVRLVEHMQELSVALPSFFDPANRKLVVDLRNSAMAYRGYEVTTSGIVHLPREGDAVEIFAPAEYTPIHVRSLGRLKRALRT